MDLNSRTRVRAGRFTFYRIGNFRVLEPFDRAKVASTFSKKPRASGEISLKSRAMARNFHGLIPRRSLRLSPIVGSIKIAILDLEITGSKTRFFRFQLKKHIRHFYRRSLE